MQCMHVCTMYVCMYGVCMYACIMHAFNVMYWMEIDESDGEGWMMEWIDRRSWQHKIRVSNLKYKHVCGNYIT